MGTKTARQCQHYFSRCPLEMTYGGNKPTMLQNNTLAFQPVGACIASPLCCIFPNVRFFLSNSNVRLYRITLNVKIITYHVNPPSRL